MKKYRVSAILGVAFLLFGLSACRAATSSHEQTGRKTHKSEESLKQSRRTQSKKAEEEASRKKAAEESSRKAEEEAAQATNHNAAASAYATPAKQVQSEMIAPLNEGAIKTVYLTFDDGPNNVNTPKVLDILKKAEVHATFFVVGNQIGPNTAAVLKRTHDEGHGIGLHSYDHTYAFETKGDVAATKVQIDRVYSAVRGVLGENFKTGAWRYPGGHMSWAKTLGGPDKVVAEQGLAWIDWNAASGDALGYYQSPKSVAAMLDYHKKSLQAYGPHPATVVLMHDSIGKDITVQALPQIIDYYKQNGYRFGIIE